MRARADGSESGGCTIVDRATNEDEAESERAGDSNEDLPAVLYDQLRGIAGACMRSERAGHTLQPTALVNEVYLKLAKSPVAESVPKSAFLAIAARAMRQVLVDYARGRLTEKRGGGWDRVTLDAGLAVTDSDGIDLIALDEALTKLSKQDERLGRVVELRFFGGLTIDEVAEVLSVSHTTVESDWKFARAWLKQRMEGPRA